MTKPNKTVENFRRKMGKPPQVVAAERARWESDPMRADMEKFQRGEMTETEFKQKWCA